MVDAGSSGSRLFVYSISSVRNNSPNLPFVNICKDAKGNPVIMKVTPGFSSYAKNHQGFNKYVQSMLDVAASFIPSKMHSFTPLFIFATAGMRLLPNEIQEKLWSLLRTIVRENYKFNFEDFYCHTVTGESEALYGWITINYLLEKFPINEKPIFDDTLTETVGMLDLGGASMQIAFEVPPSFQAPSDNIMKFSIGHGANKQSVYHVYVTSFLGFGTQSTRQKYKINLLKGLLMHSKRVTYNPLLHSYEYNKISAVKYFNTGFTIIDENDVFRKLIIPDPCLPVGLQDTLLESDVKTLDLFKSYLDLTVFPKIIYEGTGDLFSCLFKQKGLLNKNLTCDRKPCSMNGVYQPPIIFENFTFYGMSEFWYTISDVLGDFSEFSFSKFQNLSQIFCKTNWNITLSKYRNMSEDSIRIKKSVCFKAAWIINIMLKGFGFPNDYTGLQPIYQFGGTEVQWSLGALIYHLPEVIRVNSFPVSNAANDIDIFILVVVILLISIVSSLIIFCCLRIRRPFTFRLPKSTYYTSMHLKRYAEHLEDQNSRIQLPDWATLSHSTHCLESDTLKSGSFSNLRIYQSRFSLP